MTDYNKILEELIEWTRTAMEKAGGKIAILGVSGGKDSSVTAALLARALGSDKVLGVLMPDGEQKDIADAIAICDHLGIDRIQADISSVTKAFLDLLQGLLPGETSAQTKINLPPRVRMTLLYAISQSIKDSRVINTSNISEDWVGYATIYGDTAGAFSPLGMLTTEEVIELGRRMGVPEPFLVKPPADGLTGKTDEAILGVTYGEINRYIRTGEVGEEAGAVIDHLHKGSRFKFLPIPMFDPGLPIKGQDIDRIYGGE